MKLKINLIQSNIIWANPEANHNHLSMLMRSVGHGDVYVLPEMFSTGFAITPDGIAEDVVCGTCQSIEWMKYMAKELDAAVAGSVAVREEDGRYYNRFCFVRPDGDCSFYNKRHLFTYGGENQQYSAGTERVVAEFSGVRFLLQICYDLRFPVFSRNSAAEPYDAIIYVANWPASRIDAWQTLLKARAIENQCYVCAVNRVGEDASCKYYGGSFLINAYGNIVAQCPIEKEGVACMELDIDALTSFRKKFPVLKDAD